MYAFLLAKYKYLLYDQPFYLIYAQCPSVSANKLKLNRFIKKLPPRGYRGDPPSLLKMLGEL